MKEGGDRFYGASQGFVRQDAMRFAVLKIMARWTEELPFVRASPGYPDA